LLEVEQPGADFQRWPHDEPLANEPGRSRLLHHHGRIGGEVSNLEDSPLERLGVSQVGGHHDEV
jgi:hypothetical protein